MVTSSGGGGGRVIKDEGAGAGVGEGRGIKDEGAGVVECDEDHDGGISSGAVPLKGEVESDEGNLDIAHVKNEDENDMDESDLLQLVEEGLATQPPKEPNMDDDHDAGDNSTAN